MKKYIIIAFIVIAQLGSFYLKANSQSIKWSSENTTVKGKEVEVLADETTLSYTDKFAKIECDNDSVFYKIFTTHYQIISRFTASWKYDRHGRYKHYTLYLNREDVEIIRDWAKSNL